jgi:PAS domain S-box-containing protein
MRLVDERSRLVEIDGERFALIAAVDLSEERRMLQDLEASRADLAKAQAISQIGSYTFDLRTNEVLASDELLRLLWTEPAEFDGTLDIVLAHIHPDDVDLVRDAIALVLEEHTVPTVRLRTASSDGRVRWLQAQGELELDEDGRAARVHGTAQDVTERVRMEERNRRLLERAVELRESDRREIAEEIQEGFLQSLSGLMLRVEAAADASADPDARYEVARVVDSVRASAERLRRLVFDVRPTALDHGIGPAVEELATRMLASWDLHVDVEDDTPQDAVPDSVRATVYRFLREALAALAPGVAAVRIAVEDDLVVEVRHRGPGRLDEADRPLLEEAAELAGGLLELEIDGETRVRLSLPDPSLSVET